MTITEDRKSIHDNQINFVVEGYNIPVCRSDDKLYERYKDAHGIRELILSTKERLTRRPSRTQISKDEWDSSLTFSNENENLCYSTCGSSMSSDDRFSDNELSDMYPSAVLVAHESNPEKGLTLKNSVSPFAKSAAEICKIFRISSPSVFDGGL
jgi:hypothetical protein